MKKQGTVKWFNHEKGYGFISPEGGGKDVFVHVMDVKKSGLDKLAEGQAVWFAEQDGKKDVTARDIEVAA